MQSVSRAALRNYLTGIGHFFLGTSTALVRQQMKRTYRLVWNLVVTVLLLASALVTPSFAVTLQQLKNDTELTPERFARYFADFEFELGETVQAPEAFLATKKGDCDDYATLAADLLKARGYTTRLIVVFMPKDIHVVCYVEETKCFLDFNRRQMPITTVPCNTALEDIAEKVAGSFKSKWHCVSEFTFKNGVRHFVYTDFPQEKPTIELLPADAKSSAKPLVSKAP
jgi:hypothetical protein